MEKQWTRRTITQQSIERQRQYRSKEHRAARRRVLAEVESGEAFCWRCGAHIPPGSPVHVGHDDDDRSIYRGPEHPECNIRAAARKGRQMQKRQTIIQQRAASVIPEDKPCVGCGVTFTTRWPDQKYCNRRCAQTNRPRRPKPTKQPPLANWCVDCGEVVGNGKRCKSCRIENQRTIARNAYRKRVGIPLDAPLSANGRPRSA